MSVAQQEQTLEERPKVLVVDDEPFNLEIMEEILEEDFDVSYARSGMECMDMVMQVMPDVVLLDVNMPGMSGYEVCQQLKENPKTTNIPVTFVSALDTLAERLAGYEVGGDDYICKPFEASELLSKVSIAVKYKKEREILMVHAEQAMHKAMSAMKNTGDPNVLLDFMRSSLSCDNAEQLLDLALYTITSMGLRSSVQIRIGEEVIHKSSDGAINQLERTVVKKMCKEDKIVDLGVRSVFNFDHVSVLIKNMPLDDKLKYDSVKNNIALLAEAVEIRILAIVGAKSPVASVENISNPQEFVELSARITSLLSDIERATADVRPQYIKILSDLAYKLESAFSNLELTEEQEQLVMDMVDGAINDAHALQSSSEQTGQQISALVNKLQAAVKAS